MPYKYAFFTSSRLIAISSVILFPCLRSKEKNGIAGLIFTPASTTMKGMPAIFNEVLVIIAGVGFPSGVAGTPLIQIHLP